ncbi:MAG TPA: hypothetical protein VFD84_02360 [Candidatus Binatia bacterium]|nr:hypothetical protein [Candidatus Binatia bacterium]
MPAQHRRHLGACRDVVDLDHGADEHDGADHDVDVVDHHDDDRLRHGRVHRRIVCLSRGRPARVAAAAPRALSDEGRLARGMGALPAIPGA